MIDEFLLTEIEAGSFPGASYAIGSLRGIELSGALGEAVVLPARIPATVETIYDCASVTKVLVTTVLVLQAIEEKRLSLDTELHGIPLHRYLTHTSGLRAWMPLYAGTDYLRQIVEEGREYEPGTKVVYSDLNFVVLWYALTSIFGDYVAAARARIFDRLGIGDEAMFHPPLLLLPRIAATEFGQRFEVQKLARRAHIDGAREGLMWGETNDGNSWHNGGTAGNAGLFATARAVYRIAQGWLDGTLVSRPLFELATRNHTPGLNENRGLGWQLRSDTNRATSMLSEGSFGHMGFTGTSVWIDPVRDRLLVLLTNRVHPCAAPIAMQRVRGEFHRLAL
ncbi:MAG: beta-lactamase [Acidobacteria bacterium]|nr:beta-lactamase [Acidobacteriota bacterium]